MTTSRTAMRATGTHQNAPSATNAMSAPSTSTLSANGSRKAPELVLPWRRATQPSRASLPATAIQTPSVDHDAGRSMIRRITTGASRRRAAVRALAGVARAEGPKDPGRPVRPPTDEVVIDLRRLEIGSCSSQDPGPHERPCAPPVGDGEDAIDLGRLSMGAGDARLVDQHVDGAPDEGGPA